MKTINYLNQLLFIVFFIQIPVLKTFAVNPDSSIIVNYTTDEIKAISDILKDINFATDLSVNSDLDNIMKASLANTAVYAPYNGGEDDLQQHLLSKAIDYAGHPKVGRAEEVANAITENKLVDKFLGTELVELPVGIRKTIGANTYTVMIARIHILPDRNVLEVYCVIETSDGRTIIFGSDDIEYSPDGGIVGDAVLGLFSDFPFTKESSKIGVVLKKFVRMQDGNHSGCYVRIDCDGFVEMRVDADLLLSRDWIIPVNGNTGEPLGDSSRVTANFAITMADWDDMVVQTSFSPFALAVNPQIAFNVSDVIIDFSDTRNAPGFVEPPKFIHGTSSEGIHYIDYIEHSVPLPHDSLDIPGGGGGGGGAPPPPPEEDILTWKGLYFGELSILIPKEFKKNSNNTERIVVGAQNLYIDSKGVTGKLFAENIISFGESNLDKWDFSIDNIEVFINYSKVYRFAFSGSIILPVNDSIAPMHYNGHGDLITNTYAFGARLGNSETKFPVFGNSEVTLSSLSFIRVEVVDGDFSAMASLTGQFNTQATEEGSVINLPKVRFRKLILTTEAPYISLGVGGSITLDSGAILNNSIINISNASLMREGQDKIVLTMELSANLMSEGNGGVNTGGKFGIVGRFQEVNGYHRWVFDGLKMMSLSVDIAIGSHVRINGTVETFNDGTRSGFRGELIGGFVSNGSDGYKFNMMAKIMFGTENIDTEDEYKYWYFDAFVSSDYLKVPIGPNLFATGFGGGAYHHMRMGTYTPPSGNQNWGDLPNSGVKYDPCATTLFGLKASMNLETATGALKGVVTFEMSFSSSMALQNISFFGQGEFVSDNIIPGGLTERLSKLKDDMGVVMAEDETNAAQDVDDKIKAAVALTLNFTSGFELHGSFAAYLSAANNMITGQGVIDLYFNSSSNDWHLYIGGYPDNSVVNHSDQVIPPVSVSIDYGVFEITASLYFMTGNGIPGAPPIDPRAASFFNISGNQNNRALLGTGGRSPALGSGFAFGASAFFNFNKYNGECGILKKNKKPVYVGIMGGAGFDISLLKYSSDTECSLKPGSNGHGLNGWRAGGRLWTFMGVTGGRWKVLGACANIPRFSAGILFDGDVPNPSYFRAAIVFKVIGININLKADIGEQCGQVVTN